MATTAVPYSNLVPNADLANPAGTAITSGAGNGGEIANAIPEQTVIRIANASGGAGTVTVLAGNYPPALATGLGAFTSASIANGASAFLGPFESGRFLRSTGSLIVECSVNVTMTAFRVPRNT